MDDGPVSDPPITMDAVAGASAAALDRAIAERDAWAQELFEANRFAAQLVIERQQIADQLAALRTRERDAAQAEATGRIEAAQRERNEAFAERDSAREERDQALRERDQARIAHHDAAAMLQRVTSSTAWRVTSPARRAVAALLGRQME